MGCIATEPVVKQIQRINWLAAHIVQQCPFPRRLQAHHVFTRVYVNCSRTSVTYKRNRIKMDGGRPKSKYSDFYDEISQ